MPKPRKDETRKEFMRRCVPMVLDDGGAENQDQAVAMCSSFWSEEHMEKKSLLDSDMLIIHGGSVKALGNGQIAGYLVRYTTDQDPDLERDFFSKDTNFGDHEMGTVYYQHGLDQRLGKRRLSLATHTKDDFGVWAETQLMLRDEYERFIYAMAEKGKLGWSSATAPHLVERERVGKAMWIKNWPLGLDDTLSPTPAEPRNAAIPLKSWKPVDLWASEDGIFTIAERTGLINSELKHLLSDLRGLVDGIDKPLSEIKRKELTELLDLWSGMDAVRTDLQSVLTTAPTQKLVTPKMISYQMADARKRLANILEQE